MSCDDKKLVWSTAVSDGTTLVIENLVHLRMAPDIVFAEGIEAPCFDEATLAAAKEHYIVILRPKIDGVTYELRVRPNGSFSCTLGNDPVVAQAMLIGTLLGYACAWPQDTVIPLILRHALQLVEGKQT